MVSGKGKGYYGCLSAMRKKCSNKVLVSRSKLEKHFIDTLKEKIFDAEMLEKIYAKVSEKIKDQLPYIPKELKLKKVELDKYQTKIKNFINFIASGRATASL